VENESIQKRLENGIAWKVHRGTQALDKLYPNGWALTVFTQLHGNLKKLNLTERNQSPLALLEGDFAKALRAVHDIFFKESGTPYDPTMPQECGFYFPNPPEAEIAAKIWARKIEKRLKKKGGNHGDDSRRRAVPRERIFA
jgi:hypothetical protein